MADKAVTPSWNGDPSSFEEYVTAAKWFERGTKASERNLVVARLWSQLTGAAKSVVRYLEPEQYEGEDGLKRFLDVLRASPLQQLPIPDSFARLEKWHNLKRSDRETVAELIVKEEQLFTELQQSLTRARRDRMTGTYGEMSPKTTTRDPPTTPSRSPTTAAATGLPIRDPPVQSMYPSLPQVSQSDFFEDELRGYRLLRASRISSQEKQNVLVQTSGSTSFMQIRRALRTLYAEESDRQQSRHPGKIWYGEWNPADEENYDDEFNGYDAWWNEWDGASDWNDWSPQTYWQDQDWSAGWDESWNDPAEEIMPNENSTDPEEVQLAEAYALASESHRTLKDAREAVRRVRQARGYFSPESNSGKGIVPSASGSPSSSAGKGQAKNQSLGPCFRCGMMGHSYLQCPDRFSGYKGGKPKGKGFGKGKPFKGKGKGKSISKGKTYFMDLSCILSAQWDDAAVNGRSPTRAVLDTGASENAIGIDCLNDLVVSGKFSYEVDHQELPTFRFGNGHKDQALSRASLSGTSLGTIHFYVLGGMAKGTPPLIGARTLREKHAMLSYMLMDHFVTLSPMRQNQWQFRCKLWPLDTWQLTLPRRCSGFLCEDLPRPNSRSQTVCTVGKLWVMTSFMMPSLNWPNQAFAWFQFLNNMCMMLLALHQCRNVCSNWLQGSEIFSRLCNLKQVMEREAAPCDDIRHKGYPCFGTHKPGKQRQNQYASWMACARCALRLSYTSKDPHHGKDRQSYPEPHLLRATMEELEKTVSASSCAESLVQGKLMELKGKMVQAGLTNNRSTHMTYAEYLDRLRRAGYMFHRPHPCRLRWTR